jgi:hypothetical protein
MDKIRVPTCKEDHNTMMTHATSSELKWQPSFVSLKLSR